MNGWENFFVGELGASASACILFPLLRFFLPYPNSLFPSTLLRNVGCHPIKWYEQAVHACNHSSSQSMTPSTWQSISTQVYLVGENNGKDIIWGVSDVKHFPIRGISCCSDLSFHTWSEVGTQISALLSGSSQSRKAANQL